MAVFGQKWSGCKSESVTSGNNCLTAVRTLHQTVVDLRTALEKSRSELNRLRSKISGETSISRYSHTIENLTLENHILRQTFFRTKEGKSYKEKVIKNVVRPSYRSMEDLNKSQRNFSKSNTLRTASADKNESTTSMKKGDASFCETENVIKDVEADAGNKMPDHTPKDYKDIDRKVGYSQTTKTDSEESEEVDDIEIIFTTDDTRGISIQEELEPISDDGGLFESKPEINLQGILTQSVLVETDISKCGIVYDIDHSFLYPNVSRISKIQYHPYEQSENRSVTLDASKLRPVLHESTSTVRDSEAQTDISALPPCWKSESYLANNKSAGTFTTLPSKFAIPDTGNLKKCSLNLRDKTKEARRVLLSDINFTSMVPELSRSVDHLYQRGINVPNISENLGTLKHPLNLISGSSQSRFDFNTENSNWDCYGGSSYSHNPSIQDLNLRRKEFSRPSVYSLDVCYSQSTSSVPPSPTQRRHSSTAYSPSNLYDNHFMYPSTFVDKVAYLQKARLPAGRSCGSLVPHHKQKSKVTFKDSTLRSNIRQSLPNVHIEPDSEDSTESLINESEAVIRKSIDAIVPGKLRTYSESDLSTEFIPPLSARPFIARSPNDLRVNYLVKVINTGRRIVVGKVQYVGILSGKSEYHVGVVLSNQTGDNDGCYQGQRYFTW